MKVVTGLVTAWLLVSAAPLAGAACAWVLWEHRIADDRWTILHGTASQDYCDELRATRLWEEAWKLLSAESIVKRKREPLPADQSQEIASQVRYLCLPDTLDPRERQP